jgi:hypothetical membrane protein
MPNFIKISGLAGIIAPLLILIAILTATFLCGPECGNPIPPPFNMINSWKDDGSFSWRSNALSDLAISKVSPIFNSSIFIGGILLFIFAVGFVMTYAKNTLFYLGGILLMISSVSQFLVAIFTEAYPLHHIFLAYIVFILTPTGLILIGLSFRSINMKSKGNLSIVTGVLTLLAILFPWNIWLGIGFAVSEMIIFTLIWIWMIWMGVGLIRLSETIQEPR